MFWLPLFSSVRNVKSALVQLHDGNIFLLSPKDRWTSEKNISAYKINKKNFGVLDSDPHHKWITVYLLIDFDSLHCALNS